MYKQCRTEQSSQRQRYIAHAFLSLLQEQSFAKIQITELCRRAGIPRKAFYRYFDTKEDVILFLAEDTLHEMLMIAESEPLSRDLNPTYNVDIFRYLSEHRDLLLAMGSPECIGIFYTTFMSKVLQMEIGFSHSTARSGQKEQAAVFTAAGFFNLLIYWQRRGFRQTPEEMGELFQRLTTEPLYH